MSAGGGGELPGPARMARRHAGPATRDELAPGMLMRALGVGVEDEGAAAGERADPAPSAARARLAVAAVIAGTALLAGVLGPGAGAGRYSAESRPNVRAAARVNGLVETQGDSFVKTKKFSSDVVLGAAAAAAVSMSALAGDAVQWRVADGGNGHWYARIDNGAIIDWRAAKSSAESMGGYLACIGSASENNWIWSTLVQPTSSGWDAWFGLHQQPASAEPSGGWTWISGEPLTFTSWCGNQPDNSIGYEDFGHYMTLHGPGCWNDIREDGSYGGVFYIHDYIVEWSADCNSDGFVDYGQCHDGTLPDYNGNNIPDCCEQGVQCTVGNYPVQWRVEDGGNGHWYLATRPIVPLNWQGSIDACTATRGHLPTLASQAENNFVMALALGTWLATDTPTSGPFIGGRRSSSQQTSACAGWQWITNEPFNYVAEFPTGDSKGYGPCGSVCQCMNNFYQDEQVLAYWDRSFPVWNSCQETNISAVLLVEWSADCNNDNIVDHGQILNGTLPDTNTNNIPDCCEPGNSCCLGDIYENHIVDGGDLGVLLSEWGVVTPTTRSDLNRDGFVDGADLGRLLANWGPCGG